jgi:hypothetical protein
MQSRFFQKNDLSRSEDFKKDTETLVALKPEVLGRLSTYVQSVRLARGDRETDIASEAAATALEVPRAQLDHALNLGQFFLREFLRSGDAFDDAPEKLVADLKQMVAIPEEKVESVIGFFRDLKQLAEGKAEKEILRLRFAQKSLPVLKSITATVNYRAVFDDYFKVDTNIQSYAPKCIDIIPMAIINLTFDEGPTQDIYFQADGRTIGVFINHLRALQKEFEIVATTLPMKEGEDHAGHV